MKFVIHGRYNAALCGHFGEIRKEISTKVWFHNLSGIGKNGTDAEQDTESENESDSEWREKIFITKLLKNKKLNIISICTV